MNRQEQDIRILQKVNAAHRSAFQEKFPGQCEHILRLITERLHLGLTKTPDTVIDRPETWALSTEQIVDLAKAMHYVHSIRQSL